MISKTKQLLFLLSVFSIAIQAQRTRYITFSNTKFNPPIISKAMPNSKICFAIKSSHRAQNDGALDGSLKTLKKGSYYNAKFDYNGMKTSFSYPNYISEIHLEPNNQIIAKYKKTQYYIAEKKMLNSFKYSTRLSAIHYITDLDNKVTYTRKIDLKDDLDIDEKEFYKTDSYKLERESLNTDIKSNATVYLPNVDEKRLEKYIKDGELIIDRDLPGKIYNEQIRRIKKNADNFIKQAFFDRPYEEKLDFHFIKKFKGFDIVPFNKGTENVKIYFKENKKEPALLEGAIKLWKQEINKLDLNQKRQKKLYVNGLENIVMANYLLGNQDEVKKNILEVSKYSKRDNYLRSYIITEKKEENLIAKYNITVSDNTLKKTFVANSFKAKSPNKINVIYGHISTTVDWSFKLFRIKELAEEGNGPFLNEYVYNSFKHLHVEKFLKKNYPEVASSLKKYVRTKRKSGSNWKMSEFFKEHPISEINKNISKESLIAYFNDAFKKINPEHKDIIKLVIDFSNQIYIIKNHNLKVDKFIKIHKELQDKIEVYAKNKKTPHSEDLLEVINDLKLINTPKKVINLSKKDIFYLDRSLRIFCSELYPYF